MQGLLGPCRQRKSRILFARFLGICVKAAVSVSAPPFLFFFAFPAAFQRQARRGVTGPQQLDLHQRCARPGMAHLTREQ